jgi:hypothetical protein
MGVWVLDFRFKKIVSSIIYSGFLLCHKVTQIAIYTIHSTLVASLPRRRERTLRTLIIFCAQAQKMINVQESPLGATRKRSDQCRVKVSIATCVKVCNKKYYFTKRMK